jgi:flavin reductase
MIDAFTSIAFSCIIAGTGSNAMLEADFRKAMRTLTSAVCVVSTAHAGRRFGMTATSVTSLSAEPPSILVCINQAASVHEPVSKSQRLCANILRADQIDLAQAFSSKITAEARFCHGRWRDNAEGMPYLGDAQANVFCNVEAVYGYATHSIVVGKVTNVMVGEGVAPLIYQDGRYTVGLGEGIDWVVSIGG